MYYPQLRSTPGVGLFNDLIPNIQLSYELEQKIISQLDINTVLLCARLNKIPWHRRMMEEVKRRKNCVTIYTWPAAETSSERARGRLGHSALKTYSGSMDGKGVYVSFYPDDCHKNNRHPSCRKRISHFHSWNQESRNTATIVDLYGLDIEAINRAFQDMHDSNMNSKEDWSYIYNCSDLIFKLLIKGGLINRATFIFYGLKTIILVSFLGNLIIQGVIDSIFACYNEGTPLKYKLFIYLMLTFEKFTFTPNLSLRLMCVHLPNFLFGFISQFLYAREIYKKLIGITEIDKFRTIYLIRDSFLGGVTNVVFHELLKRLYGYFNIDDFKGTNFTSYLGSDIITDFFNTLYKIYGYEDKFEIILSNACEFSLENQNVFNVLKFILWLLILCVLISFPKLIYDKVNTPNYVLNNVKEYETHIKTPSMSALNFSNIFSRQHRNKLTENRNTSILSKFGIFAVKGSQSNQPFNGFTKTYINILIPIVILGLMVTLGIFVYYSLSENNNSESKLDIIEKLRNSKRLAFA